GGRRRRRVAAALPDSSALADLAAQVVETALAYIAVPQHVDLVDPRRVHEEGALHADPVGHAPHREVLAQSSACDPDHRAFEDLYALARALDDLGVNLDRVAGAQRRHFRFLLLLFELLNDVHFETLLR